MCVLVVKVVLKHYVQAALCALPVPWLVSISVLS